MCRLLGYFGQPTLLTNVLEAPEHSLIVQSYQPREMTAGLLNADGFGIGWYHAHHADQNSAQYATEPYIYKNTLPIWNDINLPHLSRYIESGCVLANVRSATPGLAVDLSNCQPFRHEQILCIHNGFIDNFRRSLYRPIRNQLSDQFYQGIHGTTDSEHIFALLLSNLELLGKANLAEALQKTLIQILIWAREFGVSASLNVVISDGHQLVASRCATHSPAPSLYWLKQDSRLPNAAIVASEPLFENAAWLPFEENTILAIERDRHTSILYV
ncbi:ergothioneine biosynthesis protein EgtC [Tumidithrix elongata RA019]|uniref:Ergothioneine biosynthesis protein EgtC n=1 Tax=Tumidithrix elongata BACA0141 TaxID=2716417 RepID=A0AAW9PVL8_9CYAN|nr:ergothioneine biosynthesis protein EgtC [Tumidithrix elongata RA019]